MPFNPRALTERTLKGFVDRWVRAQRAKPCPTPDQWPPARTVCQEDIAQLLGFANWHEAITAIRQLQTQSPDDAGVASAPSSIYQINIDSIHDAVSFLTWAYDQGLTSLNFHAGAPISSQGRVLTPQALSNLQHALFHSICLRSNDLTTPPLLLRPNLSPLQLHSEVFEDGHMVVNMSTHRPIFPSGFEAVPQPLMSLLETPPKQGLVLLAGLAKLLPSTAIAMAERYVRMSYEHRVFHTLNDLDLTQRFGERPTFIQYTGPETLELKIRRAMPRRPTAMVLTEPQTPEDVDQTITASLTGHLVYAPHSEGRVVDAVVNWVGQFPQEEQSRRIVDVLAVLRLLVGGRMGPSTGWQPAMELRIPDHERWPDR